MLQRRTVSICREGLYYFFVLAFIVGGATLREKNLLFILAGMMIGPLLFNWRMVVLTLRKFEVRRRLPAQAFAGEPLRVEMLGTNRRRRLGSWAVVVEDHVERDEAAGPSLWTRLFGGQHQAPTAPQQPVRRVDRQKIQASVMLPYVPAGDSRRAAYRVTLPRRGRYRFGPVHIFTRFPLGLLKASLRSKSYQSLLVFPRLGRLSADWLQRLDSDRHGSQQIHRRQGPIDGDYYGLREWRPGDSKRWIHWRTSAKLNKLAVRQFEQQQNRDLVLVLDLWQPEEPSDEEQGRIELAISFAATLIDDLCRRGGSRLSVAVAGQVIENWSATASPAFEQHCLSRLAVTAAAAHAGLDQPLSRALGEAQPCDQVLIVSTRSRDAAGLETGGSFADHPRLLRALRRAVWVDVSDDRLAAVFDLAAEPAGKALAS